VTYRVIQWTTGNVGRYALRQILDHPELELAGVYVTSDAKVGRDAGDLCGRPPTGVRATRRRGAPRHGHRLRLKTPAPPVPGGLGVSPTGPHGADWTEDPLSDLDRPLEPPIRGNGSCSSAMEKRPTRL
jgi:hypothetical protein